MIVVYPEDIIFLSDPGNDAAKELINALVSLPETFIMNHILGKVVEEGPNSLIAEPIVVTFNIILRQKHRVALKPGSQCCLDLPPFFLGSLIQCDARPPYPDTVV